MKREVNVWVKLDGGPAVSATVRFDFLHETVNVVDRFNTDLVEFDFTDVTNMNYLSTDYLRNDNLGKNSRLRVSLRSEALYGSVVIGELGEGDKEKDEDEDDEEYGGCGYNRECRCCGKRSCRCQWRDESPTRIPPRPNLALIHAILSRPHPLPLPPHLQAQPAFDGDWSDFDAHIRAIETMPRRDELPVRARHIQIPITHNNLRNKFEGMRNSGIMCDVTVVLDACDGEAAVRLPAHRLVLAAHSPVFRAMFTGEMQEANSDEVRLDMRPSVGRVVVDFCYAGKAAVTEDIGIDLLTAADMMGMEQLTSLVVGWLLSAIRPSNVFPMWLAATRVRQTRLVEKCAEAAYYHIGFSDVSVSPARCHLVDCSSEQMADMLAAARAVLSAPKMRVLLTAWADLAPDQARHDAMQEMMALLTDQNIPRVLSDVIRELHDHPTIGVMAECCQELLSTLDSCSEVEKRDVVDYLNQHKLHVLVEKLLTLKCASLEEAALRLLIIIVQQHTHHMEIGSTVEACLLRRLAAPEHSDLALDVLWSFVEQERECGVSCELAAALVSLITATPAADAHRLHSLCQLVERRIEDVPSCCAQHFVDFFDHADYNVRLLACRGHRVYNYVYEENDRKRVVAALSSYLSDTDLAVNSALALQAIIRFQWPLELFVGSQGDGGVFSQLADLLQLLLDQPDVHAFSQAIFGCCGSLCRLVNGKEKTLLRVVFIEHHALAHVLRVAEQPWMSNSGAERIVLDMVNRLVSADGETQSAGGVAEWTAHLLASAAACRLLVASIRKEHQSEFISDRSRTAINSLFIMAGIDRSTVRLRVGGDGVNLLSELARKRIDPRCGYDMTLRQNCQQLLSLLGEMNVAESRKRKA